MNNDATGISYRIASVATNAVKAMRELYSRDGQPFLDADLAAVKGIEEILAGIPRISEYADYEAKPLVAQTQPQAHPALAKITELLASDLDEKIAA